MVPLLIGQPNATHGNLAPQERGGAAGVGIAEMLGIWGKIKLGIVGSVLGQLGAKS